MSGIYHQSFDWSLFLILCVFALPGFLIGIGGFIRTYWPYIRVHYPDFKKHNVIGGFILVSLFFILKAIVLGIYASATVNSRFIYFMAIIKQKNEMQAFLFEAIPAILIGIPAALAYLVYYYYQVRPLFDDEKLIKFEKLRNHAGLGVRILYYSMTGEIIFRWGFQSLILWIFVDIFGDLVTGNIVSIFLVSLVQGSLNILGLRLVDRHFSGKLKIRMFALHFLQSVAMGVVFWKFGILSAMVAHLILHVIWYPLDIFYYRKLPADAEI